MSEVETSPLPAQQSAKQSPSPSPTSRSASVGDEIFKCKDKDSAPQEEKANDKESKKRSREVENNDKELAAAV